MLAARASTHRLDLALRVPRFSGLCGPLAINSHATPATVVPENAVCHRLSPLPPASLSEAHLPRFNCLNLQQ
jgi:hypothetical protein